MSAVADLVVGEKGSVAAGEPNPVSFRRGSRTRQVFVSSRQVFRVRRHVFHPKTFVFGTFSGVRSTSYRWSDSPWSSLGVFVADDERLCFVRGDSVKSTRNTAASF